MAPEASFSALLLRQDDENKVTAEVETLTESDLPEGDVTIVVDYSTINYKDGMIIRGLGRIVREYPHIPGIDLAGRVEKSDSPDYATGDKVVVSGWRLGETHWGGYGQKARVPAGWLVPLPENLSARRAMALGTAGYTAMLAVIALEEHGLTPDTENEVLVTGAAGGVGSVAVTLLSRLGYKVAAGTGRAETHDYLRGLGATSIVGRDELETPSRGPLAKERWAAAIDNVGGPILANLLGSLQSDGSCAAIGMAASNDFQASVIPFLLRGINLLGINCNAYGLEGRKMVWQRLADELPMDQLDGLTEEAPLAALPGLAGDILKGAVKGRVVIDVNK